MLPLAYRLMVHRVQGSVLFTGVRGDSRGGQDLTVSGSGSELKVGGLGSEAFDLKLPV